MDPSISLVIRQLVSIGHLIAKIWHLATSLLNSQGPWARKNYSHASTLPFVTTNCQTAQGLRARRITCKQVFPLFVTTNCCATKHRVSRPHASYTCFANLTPLCYCCHGKLSICVSPCPRATIFTAHARHFIVLSMTEGRNLALAYEASSQSQTIFSTTPKIPQHNTQ